MDKEIITIEKEEENFNVDFGSLEFIVFEITHRCNLNCITCFQDKFIKDELETNQIFKVFEILNNINVKYIQFTGGEPLMRKDILEILKESCKYFETTLATNGLLLTKNFIKKINLYGVKFIQVSVDGLKDNHDKIRGQGTWEKVLKNIKLIKEYSDIPVKIKMTGYKDNIDDYPFLQKIAKKLGVVCSVSLFEKSGTGIDLDYASNKLIWENYFKKVFISLKNSKDEKYVKKYQKSIFKENGPFGLYSCAPGIKQLSIGPNGDIFPCSSFTRKEFKLGNIFTNKLTEVLKKFHIPSIEEIPFCRECDVRYWCKGSCRARTYYDKHTLYAKNPYCGLFKKLYRVQFWDILKDKPVFTNLDWS